MSRYTRRWFKYHAHQLLHRGAIRKARNEAILSALDDQMWEANLGGGRLVKRNINDVAVMAAHRPLLPSEREALGFKWDPISEGWVRDPVA